MVWRALHAAIQDDLNSPDKFAKFTELKVHEELKEDPKEKRALKTEDIFL